ncbi:hypothetical protein scyTo_0000249 [Scyliorhinus torazame]|uniref:ribonuclease H n=1 Tax=Scyliorhinus torazame TaxID=75743 RepID=A0A401NTN1_SCYTO|nr:hypothetical protein [Scyliorhinus torazame]
MCVKKPSGELRICIDPKDLNRKIMREHYPIPKREEITYEMARAKHFTKLDASKGFWQIQLDRSSRKLCTFNTPFGKYCYNRMPFGIISASGEFHRIMEQMMEAIEGVRIYVDDIIIWSTTPQEHISRLQRVFKRIREQGLCLNRAKCSFGQTELKFIGDHISLLGVRPDADKVAAITAMKKPEAKKAVLRFLGTVNFLGKFIPNLASHTTALRNLVRKTTDFQWLPAHESEWRELKTKLTTVLVLAFFEPAKETKISTDASHLALGQCSCNAVRLHRGTLLHMRHAPSPPRNSATRK